MIVNPANWKKHMPEHTIIGQASSTLSTVIDHEVSCQPLLANIPPKPDAGNTVSNISSPVTLEVTKRYETIDRDWLNNIKIPKGNKK